ncbi:MAG: hypothetical protein ACLFPR_05780 [Desulfococcaceae bacterium]
MESFLAAIKAVAALMAAMILGNWFLAEVKRAKANGAPWYQPYLTAPGFMILVLVLGVPVLWWLAKF